MGERRMFHTLTLEYETVSRRHEKIVKAPVLALLHGKGYFTLDINQFDKQRSCVLIREQSKGRKKPLIYCSIVLI